MLLHMQTKFFLMEIQQEDPVKIQNHLRGQCLMSLNLTQALTLLLLTECISHPNLGLHLIIFVTHPENQIGYK